MSLAENIKTEAYRLGFQLVGITTPEPPPHQSFYENWLAQGRQGQMDYLASDRARQARADPRLILPEVRAILVLGLRYPAPSEAPDSSSTLTGRVAAYAWGEDYHEVLPNRLRALVDFIEQGVGHPVPNRWVTDTAPLLERDLAQRAGLGWIGKNTCLIHPAHGSYFLLAEILLGLELPSDAPFLPDRCGSCTRCIQACPTGCILPDRSLDAARCISYLTIELKDAIPIDLRAQMGQWVFGCDICQQVCPWNIKFASAEGDADFRPRPGQEFPNLLEELSLTPEAFNRKARKTPLRRAKRRGYLRNIAVALGNTRATEAVPALAQALRADPEPLVRGHAAWALGRIGGPTARQALVEAAHSEQDPSVLVEISSAVKKNQLPDSRVNQVADHER